MILGSKSGGAAAVTLVSPFQVEATHLSGE